MRRHNKRHDTPRWHLTLETHISVRRGHDHGHVVHVVSQPRLNGVDALCCEDASNGDLLILIRIIDDLDSGRLVCIDERADTQRRVCCRCANAVAARLDEARELRESPETWGDEVGVANDFDECVVRGESPSGADPAEESADIAYSEGLLDVVRPSETLCSVQVGGRA